MTNFQAQPPSRFGITPERLVLVLPALAGGLVAAGLALAWLLPAWQRNGARPLRHVECRRPRRR